MVLLVGCGLTERVADGRGEVTGWRGYVYTMHNWTDSLSNEQVRLVALHPELHRHLLFCLACLS